MGDSAIAGQGLNEVTSKAARCTSSNPPTGTVTRSPDPDAFRAEGQIGALAGQDLRRSLRGRLSNRRLELKSKIAATDDRLRLAG